MDRHVTFGPASTITHSHRKPRKDSVHALLLAVGENLKKDEKEGKTFEGRKKKLSAVLEDEEMVSTAPSQRPSVATVLEEEEARPMLTPPKASRRKSSTQAFLDSTESMDHTVKLLELRLKALEDFYARTAEGKTTDDDFVEGFLHYREQHDSIVREIQRLCGVVQDQIAEVKYEVQTAGETGILDMDAKVRQLEYKEFIARLTRLMEDFQRMEKNYHKWQSGLETVQASRRCSTVSDLRDHRKMSNANEMEGPLAETRDLGTSIRDVMKALESFAWLVESQADLLDRIDELGKYVPDLELPTGVAAKTEAEVRRDFQKTLEEHERRSNIKTLILFAFVGFAIFAVLTAVVILISDGRPDCGTFPSSRRKDCVNTTMVSNMTA
ncbi:hypothetical protein RvY_18421 [Ramazzottius varieornatus]|uniref:Uncharacterized protein n=1 Tax=Ramazzottius varieornatus TaxID=947166 RepID=A0A1D1W649_RAMVA|nr:hypothetical protein RvY_18421 [Ramazzottius varieornatus]